MSDTTPLAHTLFLQLQARYPSTALITELVQVHQESYVVRCLVQLSGTTLITAMAAAPTIEQAEDQSRLRVLALLGIGAYAPARPSSSAVAGYDQLISLPPDPPPTFTPDATIPTPTGGNGTPRSAPIPPLPLTSDLGTKPSLPDPLPPEETLVPPVADKRLHSPDRISAKLPELPELPDSAPVSLPDEMSENFDIDHGLDSISEPTDRAIGEPVDLSELIALTDVEMERIGWGKKRGQSHLKRTYGKQTRAELNEDQLLEFLHFLRALPSQAGGGE